MEYSFVQPAVGRILDFAKPQNGFLGWSNPESNLSRTVTAQVIIALGKCIELETDIDKKRKISESINKGFDYLKIAIQNGHCELPSFTFTLIAILEHYERNKSINNYDVDLINICINEIRDNNNGFYYDADKAYLYSNNSNSKFFPTFLVLQSFYKLLCFIEEHPSSIKITKEELFIEIDNCFIFLYKKINNVINTIKVENTNVNEFKDDHIEYLSLTLQISKYYELYSEKYKRIPNLANTKLSVETTVSYFIENIDNIYNKWFIRIGTTPFVLIYISNIVLGLIKYRDQLSENGIILMYSLSNFLCTDDRIQGKDVNMNLLFTKIDNEPVWATAHSLNAILQIECSSIELKWIVSQTKLIKTLNTKLIETLNNKDKNTNDFNNHITLKKDWKALLISFFVCYILMNLITMLIKKISVIESFYENHHLIIDMLKTLVSLVAYFLMIFYYSNQKKTNTHS